MGLDHGDFFHLVQVVEEDVSANGFLGYAPRYMTWLSLCVPHRILLVVWQRQVIVFRARADGAYARGIQRGELLV